MFPCFRSRFDFSCLSSHGQPLLSRARSKYLEVFGINTTKVPTRTTHLAKNTRCGACHHARDMLSMSHSIAELLTAICQDTISPPRRDAENRSQLFATRKRGEKKSRKKHGQRHIRKPDFGRTAKRHHLCSAMEAAAHPVPAEVSRNETFEADSIPILVKG